MSVSELFFQSAVINFFIFAWISIGALSSKILFDCGFKIYFSIFSGLFFGPFSLLFSLPYFFYRKLNKSLFKKICLKAFNVIFLSLITGSFFYFLFIKSSLFKELGDNFVPLLYCFACISGCIVGLLQSFFTKKISFFEGCFITLSLSFSIIFLNGWAENSFSYGTSLTYFITLLLSLLFTYLIFLIVGGSVGYLVFGENKLNLRFSYESFIGFRFLMTKRSTNVISLITLISVVAVTVSCAGMIVVLSVMNGFTETLRDKILGANAHLMVMKYGSDFNHYDKIIDKTKNIDGITEINPFVLKEGMISSENNISGALFIGVELEGVSKNEHLLSYISTESIENLKNPSRIYNLKKVDAHEDKDIPGVILGKEMGKDLGIMEGDLINLISPVGDIGPTGPIPKAKPFKVCGFFDSGMYEYDSKFAYMLLSEAQEFFNLKDMVTGIEYRLKNVAETRVVAKKVIDSIGGYPFYVRDWMQMNRPMFSALQLEKIAMLIILGTLIFMASLLILVTLIMVVMEKGKEISILKTMGATDVSVMKIFVTYGLSVGITGAFLGGFLGVILCFLSEKIGISVDPDIYYFSSLPIKIVPFEVILIVLSAVLISFLATIPPALFAARLKPVDGLRYE